MTDVRIFRNTYIQFSNYHADYSYSKENNNDINNVGQILKFETFINDSIGTYGTVNGRK